MVCKGRLGAAKDKSSEAELDRTPERGAVQTGRREGNLKYAQKAESNLRATLFLGKNKMIFLTVPNSMGKKKSLATCLCKM